jgi:hypothetical protein
MRQVSYAFVGGERLTDLKIEDIILNDGFVPVSGLEFLDDAELDGFRGYDLSKPLLEHVIVLEPGGLQLVLQTVP